MVIEKEIKNRLQKQMNLEHFEIKDFTGRHLNHKLNEGGFHLEAVIVSKEFEGKNVVVVSDTIDWCKKQDWLHGDRF